MRDRVLRIYADPVVRQALRRGQASFPGVVARAFRGAGWQVLLRPAREAAAMGGDGHHMVINHAPADPFCLNLRPAYLPAFWRIEETNDRRHFQVAQARFSPENLDPARAREFADHWRPHVLGPRRISRDGFIFMPLQGRLQERRAAQAAAPLEMIEACLQADPRRPIRATLHPKESYAPEDLAALHALADRHGRLHISSGNSVDLLVACDYVVTENSSLAFQGFFAQKPAVLFGRIDFHHIAATVADLGPAEAFRQAQAETPPFDSYLLWFLRRQSIAHFEQKAPERILARCRALGWPV